MPIPDHNLSDDYLKEIGRVAVEWSRLESEIETAIWTLTFTAARSSWPHEGYGNAAAFNEEQGRAITTHIALLLRVDVMLTLASVRIANAPKYHVPLIDIAKRVRDAYPKRNRIVHGLWEATGSGAFRQTFRARGEMAAWFEVVALETIRETADEIAVLTKDLQAFIADLTELYVVRIPERLEPDPQDHARLARRKHTNGNKPKRPPRP